MGSLQGTISLGPWGGPGGSHWIFRGRGISKIVIQEQTNIKSIYFIDANGLYSGRYGGNDPDDHVGQERTGSLQGTISLGPWGGPGGGHWIFRGGRGISKIVIREQTNIKSIYFIDANGLYSGTYGGNDPNDPFGQERTVEIDWPSEYLISISGTYGSYKGVLVIMSLSFKTNLTTYGPFGSNSGESFSSPISDGVVVGFHGRGAYYLDAIGIYMQPGRSAGSISFGEWGGPGGDPFTFKVESWIKEINVLDRSVISSISFRDSNGHEYELFGGKDPNNIGEMKTVSVNSLCGV